MSTYRVVPAGSVFDRFAKHIFILPGLGVLVALVIYPTYYLIRLALSNFDLTFMTKPVFIGLGNFIQILSDTYFWGALGNTLVMASIAVALEFVFGLGMALLLNEDLRGGRIIKSLLIVPMMIPPVVVGLNFKLIFDQFGPLNDLLQRLGVSCVDWLGNPLMAKVSVILADVWQWSSFMFIIFLAGLQAIPQYLYDSAKVDGASGWRTFRFITWPMLVPSATVALTFRVMDALKIFDVVYMVTSGGPSFSTEVLSLYIYRTGFRFGTLGYASAVAVIMLILLTAIIEVIIKETRLGKRLEWE
ncbi:MAG TPA: sugar ABC transporter permease [Firmicutes bacterium]|nr:sugar ABC transporter permease [Bacillota bacterium]